MSVSSSLLKDKRKSMKLSVKEVVEKLKERNIEVSEKTVYGWESGHRQPDADTFIALCDIYGINELPGSSEAQNLSEEAATFAKRFDGLDEHGKTAVTAILDVEVSRVLNMENAIKKETKKAAKTIPLFGNSFAAGSPEPDFGLAWEDYSVDADSKADFAIKINGDSMEPYLKDGSIALGKRGQIEDGEIGAFLLDGEFLCKQFCLDYIGNVYLFSLNRKRSDADVTIWHDSGRNLMCFGKILMERVPLPKE